MPMRNFSSEGRNLVLIVPVLGHCLSFTFDKFADFFITRLVQEKLFNLISVKGLSFHINLYHKCNYVTMLSLYTEVN